MNWAFPMALAFSLLPIAHAQDLAGDWQGILKAGAVNLRLLIHLARDKDGAYSGTMDSLDQGARAIPLTSVAVKAAHLTFQVPAVHGFYDGAVDTLGNHVKGTWTQGGTFALDLNRAVAGATEPRRPQTPATPHPYRDEEVAYENAAAKIKLAATLSVPNGKGPFPAVLLITGSGPQDRDESLMGHKPFLVLADYLTRRGIAVLRADDRGVGKSGGSFSDATTADFATDAEAGLTFLQKRPEVDAHKIGLIGHSEGGLIASMLAARNRGVAFIVLMAGPGVPGDRIIPEQVMVLSEASGVSREAAQKRADLQTEILKLVESEKDAATLEQLLRDRLGSALPEAQIPALLQSMRSPWYRYFLTYDPAADLRKVACPVLALNGDKDLQVPARQNLPAIRAALEAGGNKNVEIVELPGLNHLFQTARTGLPTEYGQIEETIAPAVLEKIAAWIAKR